MKFCVGIASPLNRRVISFVKFLMFPKMLTGEVF